MAFRSVVSTRVRADAFDNQYRDELLLWFVTPEIGADPGEPTMDYFEKEGKP